MLNKQIYLVAILIFCGIAKSRIYNFNQNSYIIRFSRIDVEFWNDTIYNNFTAVAWKINREKFAINLTTDLRMEITAEDKPRMLVSGFKSTSNSYQMRLVDMNEDFCDCVKSGHYGILPGYLQVGPKPDCPVKPGKYGIYNYDVLYHKFPPGLPAGDYKLQYTLLLQKWNVRAHQWNAYGSIIYKNKLQS